MLTRYFFLLTLALAACAAPQDDAPVESSEGLQTQPPYQFPQLLHPGDLVSLVAPSNSVTATDVAHAVASLDELGLIAVYRDDIFAEELNFGGSTARRQAEMREALERTDTRAIWTMSGGFGATHVLPALDVQTIARANKLLVGISDTTVLHALWAQAGVASLHGMPAKYLKDYGLAELAETADFLFRNEEQVLHGTMVQGSNVAHGYLTGGNLTMLASLVGTPYMPDWHGAIVLFEDVREAPYRLERMLLQLDQAGAFAGVQGIVLGTCVECVGTAPEELGAIERMVNFLTLHVDVPILIDLPVGHLNTMRPVLFGASVTLDPEAASLITHVRDLLPN